METETTVLPRNNRAIAGILLIAIGIVLLLSYIVNSGLFVLPILAIIFAGVGIRMHESGWFIPAGILGGIGLGAALVETLPLAEEIEGGVFLLSFAIGWVSIPILSALFANQRIWWPFIPGGVMAVIGSLVLVGESGFTLLELIFNRAAWAWPLVLILIGAILLWRNNRD
ncbi:MAG: hypothetical protein J7464_03575 [Chloroflexus sp.]|jgi:hypothetical protein|nr:hypothetical protein [Chloroflexus sp.]